VLRSIRLPASLLLLAAACTATGARTPHGNPDPTGLRSAVRLVVSAPAGTSPSITATLRDASGERRVMGDDFRRTELLPSPHTAWYRAAESGALEVRVEVGGAPGESLGTGSVSLPLEEGWMWSVEALLYRPAAGIPAPPCSNCDVVARVPLRPSVSAGTVEGDSLFLRAARAPAAGARRSHRPDPGYNAEFLHSVCTRATICHFEGGATQNRPSLQALAPTEKSTRGCS
jgi:hypothetical protein